MAITQVSSSLPDKFFVVIEKIWAEETRTHDRTNDRNDTFLRLNSSKGLLSKQMVVMASTKKPEIMTPKRQLLVSNVIHNNI